MIHRIAVENQQDTVTLPRGYKGLLRRAVSMALAADGFDRKAEISITLVSPEEMRRLAWDRLGLVMPGERLFYFIEAGS